MAILFFLFFCQFAEASQLSVDLTSESAILINMDNGKILFEKEARRKQFPASITKIATAIYALKNMNGSLDRVISADQDSVASISEEAKRKSNYTFPSHWIEFGSSHMGIKLGEELSLRELFYGLMVVSANDAANLIAKTICGSQSKFIEGMNAYVKSLGCKDTFFTNAHGLHHPKQETTAYDMAIITIDALKHPFFRELVATSSRDRPKTNKQEKVIQLQHNRLLRKGEFFYPKAIGVKNGRTSHSETTLVAAAKDKDRTLIAVLLKSKEKNGVYKDAINLFEAAFQEAKVEKVFIKAGEQKYVLNLKEAEKPITTYATEEIRLDYFPAEEPVFKGFIEWVKLSLPIKKGEKVGTFYVESDGILAKKIDLYASDNIQGTVLFRLKKILLIFTQSTYSKILMVFLLFFLTALFFQRRSRSLNKQRN